MEDLVVGIDGSPDSMAALRWAVSEAAIRRVAVSAVLVRAPTEPPCLADAVAPPASGADRWRAILPAVRAAVAEVPGVELDVVDGEPSSILIERSAGAGLLVLGACGGDRSRRLLLGSVAGRCCRLARCATAIVRAAEHDHPDGPVVLASAGSARSRAARWWAAAEAAMRGVALEIVAVPAIAGDDDGDPSALLAAAGDGASMLVVGVDRRADTAHPELSPPSGLPDVHVSCPVVYVPLGHVAPPRWAAAGRQNAAASVVAASVVTIGPAGAPPDVGR